MEDQTIKVLAYCFILVVVYLIIIITHKEKNGRANN